MNEQTIIGIIFSACYVLLAIFICGYMLISDKQSKMKNEWFEKSNRKNIDDNEM